MKKGDSWYLKGDYKEAILQYRKVIEVQPHFITAHYNLANAYYKVGDFVLALEEYLVVHDIGGQSERYVPLLYYNIANVYYMLDRFDDAVANYKKHLLLNPDDADARYNLEMIYYRITSNPQRGKMDPGGVRENADDESPGESVGEESDSSSAVERMYERKIKRRVFVNKLLKKRTFNAHRKSALLGRMGKAKKMFKPDTDQESRQSDIEARFVLDTVSGAVKAKDKVDINQPAKLMARVAGLQTLTLNKTLRDFQQSDSSNAVPSTADSSKQTASQKRGSSQASAQESNERSSRSSLQKAASQALGEIEKSYQDSVQRLTDLKGDMQEDSLLIQEQYDAVQDMLSEQKEMAKSEIATAMKEKEFDEQLRKQDLSESRKEFKLKEYREQMEIESALEELQDDVRSHLQDEMPGSEQSNKQKAQLNQAMGAVENEVERMQQAFNEKVARLRHSVQPVRDRWSSQNSKMEAEALYQDQKMQLKHELEKKMNEVKKKSMLNNVKQSQMLKDSRDNAKKRSATYKMQRIEQKFTKDNELLDEIQKKEKEMLDDMQELKKKELESGPVKKEAALDESRQKINAALEEIQELEKERLMEDLAAENDMFNNELSENKRAVQEAYMDSLINSKSGDEEGQKELSESLKNQQQLNKLEEMMKVLNDQSENMLGKQIDSVHDLETSANTFNDLARYKDAAQKEEVLEAQDQIENDFGQVESKLNEQKVVFSAKALGALSLNKDSAEIKEELEAELRKEIDKLEKMVYAKAMNRNKLLREMSERNAEHSDGSEESSSAYESKKKGEQNKKNSERQVQDNNKTEQDAEKVAKKESEFEDGVKKGQHFEDEVSQALLDEIRKKSKSTDSTSGDLAQVQEKHVTNTGQHIQSVSVFGDVPRAVQSNIPEVYKSGDSKLMHTEEMLEQDLTQEDMRTTQDEDLENALRMLRALKDQEKENANLRKPGVNEFNKSEQKGGGSKKEKKKW